ncbi:NAD(P)H-dependent oxidoreductase subunit E [Pontiellaceae bacterium B12219]|nr:NAD(P)H-dependent oxidoreductase subunit E [Pontiellaceae bacterium B12219]
MKKVTVSICTGTTCYLMGGAHLLTINERLDPSTLDSVEFKGAHCLGLCSNESNGKPPFVKVNEHLVSDATLNKVLDAIRKELKEIQHVS